jgi:hypothetical protein
MSLAIQLMVWHGKNSIKVGKNFQEMLATLDLVLQPMVSIHLAT